MNKNILVIASLFLALIFFSPVSSFALMIERNAAELAQDAKIIVEYEGGEVGDIGVWVEDEPSLGKGEQVLLFLTNSFWRKNVYYIVGGVLGKYAICPDDTVRIGSSCDEEDEVVV